MRCDVYATIIFVKYTNYFTEYIFTIFNLSVSINLLAPELFFFILAHPVYKMWLIQEKKLELWNKLHFEEEKTESIYHV
jgi:hypothetical protein